jgi:hypothetical protein
VAFTYRLLTDPALGYANAAYWEHYDRGEEGLEVVDDFTIKIRCALTRTFSTCGGRSPFCPSTS